MNAAEIYAPKRAPERRTISIRGVDYSITEWGDSASPLIVYLHGFADCSDTFQFVIKIDNDEIPISRTYKDELMKRIQLL